jgi:hypothetical protein
MDRRQENRDGTDPQEKRDDVSGALADHFRQHLVKLVNAHLLPPDVNRTRTEQIPKDIPHPERRDYSADGISLSMIDDFRGALVNMGGTGPLSWIFSSGRMASHARLD